MTFLSYGSLSINIIVFFRSLPAPLASAGLLREEEAMSFFFPPLPARPFLTNFLAERNPIRRGERTSDPLSRRSCTKRSFCLAILGLFFSPLFPPLLPAANPPREQEELLDIHFTLPLLFSLFLLSAPYQPKRTTAAIEPRSAFHYHALSRLMLRLLKISHRSPARRNPIVRKSQSSRRDELISPLDFFPSLFRTLSPPLISCARWHHAPPRPSSTAWEVNDSLARDPTSLKVRSLFSSSVFPPLPPLIDEGTPLGDYPEGEPISSAWAR